MDSLHYASPGHISMKMNPEVASLVTGAIKRYIQNRKRVELCFQHVQDVTGKDPSKLKEAERAALEAQCVRDITELCDALGYVNSQIIIETAGDIMLAGKIVASYCRRIQALAQYQQEGKATYF
jgi:hypothetical protein